MADDSSSTVIFRFNFNKCLFADGSAALKASGRRLQYIVGDGRIAACQVIKNTVKWGFSVGIAGGSFGSIGTASRGLGRQ